MLERIPGESHAAMLGRVEASIMGDCALIDRETGRVYWEEGGGSTTLFESFGPIMDQYGLDHAQTALFTGLITLAFVGILVGWLCQFLDRLTLNKTFQSVPKMEWIFQIAAWTLVHLPRIENRWLIFFSIGLYLIESYCCSTRYYLANALSSQKELEDYIERLRNENPVVSWSVSSFHYEKRKIFAFSDVLKALKRKLKPNGHAMDMILTPKRNCKPMFPFTKKVVTHQATTTYQYESCIDSTMAGVWRRASIISDAPFGAKIALTVLLVLSDKRSREHYFKQQSDFVNQHGRGDEYTEFSTKIKVKDCKPCVLAVRPVEGVVSTRLFRLQSFWLFTLCGLTLPYRIWFKARCDFLRLTIVKETSSTPSSGGQSSARRWFSSGRPFKSNFHSFMQGQSLYTSAVALNETANEIDDKSGG